MGAVGSQVARPIPGPLHGPAFYLGPVFFGIFAEYNRSFWFVALALWVASAAALARAWRNPRQASGALTYLLAALWIWNAVAYHALLFTRINAAAWLFAGLFTMEGVLLFWAATRRRLESPSLTGPISGLGIALACYALAYPFFSFGIGHDNRRSHLRRALPDGDTDDWSSARSAWRPAVVGGCDSSCLGIHRRIRGTALWRVDGLHAAGGRCFTRWIPGDVPRRQASTVRMEDWDRLTSKASAGICSSGTTSTRSFRCEGAESVTPRKRLSDSEAAIRATRNSANTVQVAAAWIQLITK